MGFWGEAAIALAHRPLAGLKELHPKRFFWETWIALDEEGALGACVLDRDPSLRGDGPMPLRRALERLHRGVELPEPGSMSRSR